MDFPHSLDHPTLTRREVRGLRAKETIAKAIPTIFRCSARAKRSAQQVDLIVDPDIPTRHGETSISTLPDDGPRIRLLCSDTLDAASRMADRPFAHRRSMSMVKRRPQRPNVAILNHASISRPGGGFLEGGNSQEEFLCTRSTLYASLLNDLYPLPDVGGVFSPDVLVFRDSTPEANDRIKPDRFFVDVISAGMPRHGDARGRPEERLEHACTCGVSYCDRDRELIQRRMRAVLRMAQMRGTERLVLGAWGCGGPFGHPVKDIAKLWRKVIAGAPRQRRPNAEKWQGIKEIVFAIPDRSMAREFESAFKDVLTYGPPSPDSDGADALRHVNTNSEAQRAIDDLMDKMQELEAQYETGFQYSKARHCAEVAVLNRDLARASAVKRLLDEGLLPEEEGSTPLDEDDFVEIDGFVSDNETNIASLDDDDEVDSDSSETHALPEPFEFRPPPPGLDDGTSPSEDEVDPDGPFNMSHIVGPSPRFDPATGWFTGSIDQLHRIIKRNGHDVGSHASPAVQPEPGSALDGVEPLDLNDYIPSYSGR